jgi:hypothetical protein
MPKSLYVSFAQQTPEVRVPEENQGPAVVPRKGNGIQIQVVWARRRRRAKGKLFRVEDSLWQEVKK